MSTVARVVSNTMLASTFGSSQPKQKVRRLFESLSSDENEMDDDDQSSVSEVMVGEPGSTAMLFRA